MERSAPSSPLSFGGITVAILSLFSGIAGALIACWLLRPTEYTPRQLAPVDSTDVPSRLRALEDAISTLRSRVTEVAAFDAPVERREDVDWAAEVQSLREEFDRLQQRVDNLTRSTQVVDDTSIPTLPRPKDEAAIHQTTREGEQNPEAMQWRHHLWTKRDMYERYGMPDVGIESKWTYHASQSDPGLVFYFSDGSVSRMGVNWKDYEGGVVRRP